jgi:hypothetical protein
MSGPFFFAWCDGTESTFDPNTHAREDEQIFSFELSQSEGEFATLNLVVENPKVGLIGPARKRWAWFSYRTKAGVLTPLIFGRIIGVPVNTAKGLVTFQFTAKPSDFAEQKQALANTLKVLPWFDPLFVSVEAITDPDNALDTRVALWHINRTTLQVTTSSLIAGEAGTLSFSDCSYDALTISATGTPLQEVAVNAVASWTQKGQGVIDITPELLTAYAGVTPKFGKRFDGTVIHHTPARMGAFLGAEGMASSWPKFGQSLGGGWTVGASTFNFIGRRPNGDLLVGPEGIDSLNTQDQADAFDWASAAGGLMVGTNQTGSMQDCVMGDGGIIVQDYLVGNKITVVWIPVVHCAPFMELRWQAARPRSEGIGFTLTADVQDCLMDAGDAAATLTLTMAEAKVDTAVDAGGALPIVNVLRRQYWNTDRGAQSLQHLMLLARAHLLSSARCVEVGTSVPFEAGLPITLRHSATIIDERLPGGSATGKIKRYSLKLDGGTGAATCDFSIGCTIGRGGTVDDAPASTPLAIESGYTASDYAATSGDWRAIPTGDVLFKGSDIFTVPPADDGNDLMHITKEDYLMDIAVTGGLEMQLDKAKQKKYEKLVQQAYANHPTGNYFRIPVMLPPEPPDKVGSVTTETTIQMRPIPSAAYAQTYTLETTVLPVPQTIDLESA